MTDRFFAQSEPRVERLAIVESDALDERIPLLVSSNQRLFAQCTDESMTEFSRRFVDRVAGLPPARVGLLMLGDDMDVDSRWSNLLALASRLQGAGDTELVISVRADSPSNLVGWQLLERASHDAFFRGIQLRLQFGPGRTPESAASELAEPASSVRSSPRALRASSNAMIA